MEIAGQIEAFIAAELGDPAKRVTARDDLLDDGLLDSAGLAQLVSYLEEQFDIEIDDEELVPANFRTTEAIADLVARKTGATV
ncbi:MAG TPA: acyl carrier protein [Gaiellaceae bacterium]